MSYMRSTGSKLAPPDKTNARSKTGFDLGSSQKVSLSNPKTSLDLLVFARVSGGGPSQHLAIDVHL
jgi:hypothetical protein